MPSDRTPTNGPQQLEVTKSQAAEPRWNITGFGTDAAPATSTAAKKRRRRRPERVAPPSPVPIPLDAYISGEYQKSDKYRKIRQANEAYDAHQGALREEKKRADIKETLARAKLYERLSQTLQTPATPQTPASDVFSGKQGVGHPPKPKTRQRASNRDSVDESSIEFLCKDEIRPLWEGVSQRQAVLNLAEKGFKISQSKLSRLLAGIRKQYGNPPRLRNRDRRAAMK